ncbi:MAG: RNA 3'-terminal phosphate cyclase [Nitrosopumilus sp.]
MEFLKINGAHGEGGGQIVRSAITLSCITNQPIHLENIRKNRKNSGLKPQHLTAIKILQKISNAKVTGDKLGSTELKFIPGEIKNSELIEDVKTAGSIALILQVLIPAVSISKKKLSLIVKGGTDVLWSPTMNYTNYVLKEAYSRIGITFDLKITKRGYFPKGGGEIKLEVYPANVKSINFSKRKIQKLKLKCTFSKISISVIKENVKKIEEEIKKNNFEIDVEIKEEEAIDSGASVLIYSIEDNSIFGVDGLFDKKNQKFDLKIEEILDNFFGVDKNLADMLVVPLSLGSNKTKFEVSEITKHLETNLFVTSKITGCRYGIGKTSNGFEVIIEGVSNTSIK